MDPKIVVVGAGASGIAAATKLLELGFRNVLVLEAGNRIGGRIHTIRAGANVLDMGAQWCHGEQDNVVNQMAHKYNLFDTSQAQYNRFDCVRSNGEYLPTYLTDHLTAMIRRILGEAQEDLKTVKGISVGTYFCKRYEELLETPENSHIDRDLAIQFLEMYQKYECSVDGTDTLFDVSGNGFLTYWECDGDQLKNWKDRGYVTILDIMMGKYPEGPHTCNVLENRILLNKKVQTIVWDIRENNKTLVKCDDGDYIEADHVIFTGSLGVLKERHTQLFSPKLPIEKVRAIESFITGTVDKMFIEFEKPFWPKGWVGFNLIWTKEDVQNIRRSKDNWLEDVFGFYMVDYQPNVLCGWISGVNARRMEMLPEKQVLDGVMFLLRKFLKWDIPDPVSFNRSAWFVDPNFRGSYTFYSMKAEQMGSKPAHLAKPISRHTEGPPVLLFAGEATHDHYYSTVHGAIETGWREAHRIASFYNNSYGHSSEKTVDSQKPLQHISTVFDVIVIGSGLAGLGAAHTMRNANKKFIVLEAQNYIGGRVKSKQMKSLSDAADLTNIAGLIDLGAQWLHGEQNALHKIAEEYNLLTDDLSEEGLGSYIREDGYIFDDFFHKRVDFEIGKILANCENFACTTSSKYPKSVQHYLDDEFEKYIKTRHTEDERKKALEIYDWHKRFQIIDNSCLSLDQVSAKYWGMYSFNGESCQAHINYKNGFSSVVDAIARKIDVRNIKLNAKVVEIDWNVLQHKQQLVSVRTACGQTYLAKSALVTCSLGVLKKHHEQMFRPKLPQSISNCINQIGFGTINKIFLQFEHPWWSPMEGIQLIFNFDNDYAHAKWTRHLSGFDILSPGAPNTLIGWIGSYGAIEMEKLSDEEIISDCIELLKKFTKREVPQPIRFECSRWGSNEFIRGGYSYLSTKCDEINFNGSILSAPVTIADLQPKSSNLSYNLSNLSLEENDINGLKHENGIATKTDSSPTKLFDTKHNKACPILLFAGEACHPKYFSTAHGAFLSGIAQAQTILKYA